MGGAGSFLPLTAAGCDHRPVSELHISWVSHWGLGSVLVGALEASPCPWLGMQGMGAVLLYLEEVL